MAQLDKSGALNTSKTEPSHRNVMLAAITFNVATSLEPCATHGQPHMGVKSAQKLRKMNKSQAFHKETIPKHVFVSWSSWQVWAGAVGSRREIHHKERRELGAVKGAWSCPGNFLAAIIYILSNLTWNQVTILRGIDLNRLNKFLAPLPGIRFSIVVISIESTELTSLVCACPNLTRSKVHPEPLSPRTAAVRAGSSNMAEIPNNNNDDRGGALVVQPRKPCVSFPFPKSLINLRALSILNSQLTGLSLKVAGKQVGILGHSIHHNNSILGYKESSDKSHSDSKVKTARG
ncbi:hypothetical protein Prudu_93S000100 [Prunus dulcis]|uniref:Uncharacterized protein n=1 Tax=Prunus dulcis TaxID=3755 RepID=A0A5H2Y295_PRUDU|nr:hypothetical protein Prudu_93S000100 [Prunus dulcis]